MNSDSKIAIADGTGPIDPFGAADAELNETQADRLISDQLNALAHPMRLQILRHLGKNDQCCCGDVVRELPLAQSTVSQHLKILVEAGFVIHENNRPKSSYKLNHPALASASASVSSLVSACCPNLCNDTALSPITMQAAKTIAPKE